MRTYAGVSKTDLTGTELLSLLLQYTFGSGRSIAVWRLPEDNACHAIISDAATVLPPGTELEGLAPGFIFAPFQREQGFTFLPASFQFHFTAENDVSPADIQNESAQALLQELTSSETRSSAGSKHYVGKVKPESREKQSYVSLVENGISEIGKGSFEKFVPSRAKEVALPAGFDAAGAFMNLCKTYPNAFVSFVSTPDTGTWLGATPEQLVRIKDKTIFSTVALAGTQRYTEGTDIRKVAWTQKEIEEQALVERYIISCFKKIRLREYEEHGPRTVVAGNLMHLKSEFTVNMVETAFPQLGSVMLGLLHPTSAVCGMPMEPAMKFLTDNEGYTRQYYSGYLGPVNINGNIDVFVNLRCMQLFEKTGVLYAGAGVTAGSVPELEWEETELKMKTLLNVLNRAETK